MSPETSWEELMNVELHAIASVLGGEGDASGAWNALRKNQ